MGSRVRGINNYCHTTKVSPLYHQEVNQNYHYWQHYQICLQYIICFWCLALSKLRPLASQGRKVPWQLSRTRSSQSAPEPGHRIELFTTKSGSATLSTTFSAEDRDPVKATTKAMAWRIMKSWKANVVYVTHTPGRPVQATRPNSPKIG